MEYVVLKNEVTGEVEKIGRFRDDGIAESLRFGEWLRDRVLDSEMFDGLLEDISEAEAERLIDLQHQREKVAA